MHTDLGTLAPPEGAGHPARARKGVKATIYLLPNMITATSLFFGFLSMKLASDGNFLFAAYCVLAAGLCDGLDGSVARLTRTQSEFGVQFDSLCDLVAFGVAPAWLSYEFAGQDFGRFGFATCFVFVACGALRLARFNVASAQGKANGNFIGIPIPIAAACVAVFVMLQMEMNAWLQMDQVPKNFLSSVQFLTSSPVQGPALLGLLFVSALGMISSFEYLSTKKIKLPRRKPFRVLAGILMVTVFLVTIDLTITLFVLLTAYVLHGPILWIIYKRDRSAVEDEIFDAEEEEQD